MLNIIQTRYSLKKEIKSAAILLAVFLLMAGTIMSQSKGTGISDVYDNATYLSQSTPGEMIPGQTYGVSVTMRNTGRSTWNKGTYSLKVVNGSEFMINRWGVNTVEVNSSVSPGSEVVFNFNLLAPVDGSYNIQWQMASGGAFFGEPSINVPVRVAGKDVTIVPDIIENNALFLSQKMTSEMEAGQTYDMTVVMKNTGSTTWKPGEYKLKVSTVGADNTLNAWVVANVELSREEVANNEVVFTFKVTAPNKPGVYNLQCQLVKDGTFFGQPSTNVVVTVD